MEKNDLWLVRLKPYDPSKGNVKKQHVVFGWDRMHFKAGDWHRLPKAHADYLVENTPQHDGSDAQPAFEAYPESEARRVVTREKMERLGRTVDHTRPAEPEIPNAPEVGGLAYDFNAGDPEHDLELPMDPIELVAEEPKKKRRGRPRKQKAE